MGRRARRDVRAHRGERRRSSGGIAAIAGSAQQHGSVYLNRSASAGLGTLDPGAAAGRTGAADAVAAGIARSGWTRAPRPSAARSPAAVGGDAAARQRTGSRAFERFTGPQIRKFSKTDPVGYDATDRIHLVSSFMASLLSGAHAPLDPGDGSGMNLMDLASGDWWAPARRRDRARPGAKLPPIRPAWTIAGTLSPYWQQRHGFPPARVVAWSGDNPCSLIGTGLVREGRLADLARHERRQSSA